MGPVSVGRVQAETRQPIEQGAQRDPGFEPGERRTQTEMPAGAEGDVPIQVGPGRS